MSDYFVTKDSELLHFGVKGMKWGVRKKRDEGGSRISRHLSNSLNPNHGIMDRNRSDRPNMKKITGYDPSDYGIRSKTSNRDGVVYARSRQREEARKFQKEYAKNRIREGAMKASIVLGIVGGYYLWDKVTNDGDSVKAIKKTTVAIGKALVDGYIDAMKKYGDD